MDACIIYFSQTGNTQKVTESIYEGMVAAGAQCNMFRLKNMTAELLSNFDLIGLGSPVFYYQEPLHVRAWIKSLPDQEGKNWFVFCTHGSIIGNFFPSVTTLLRQKNAAIIGYYHSYAAIRVPFLPSPGLTGGHPDANDLAKARSFGVNIVSEKIRISDGKKLQINDKMPISSKKWLAQADRFNQSFLLKTMPKLKLNWGKCSQCKICEDQCPVSGIAISELQPRLQNPCIFCWNCVCSCPEAAIEADWSPLVSTAPDYFARCQKELNREAQNGSFRWLIDPEAIDTSDVYIYR